ncbi:MAG TPA: VWA domain-containing protein, partial [Gammaproteobacteria bacterium]|nr:VWA domain-containing protein [Gammaproteobacteria bacterium]
MPGINIIDREIAVNLSVQKGINDNTWVVTPLLKAAPAPKVIKPRNIIFVLDVSSSMQGKVGNNTRVGLVSQATMRLFDQLSEQDTFSVITFNDTASTLIGKNQATFNKINEAKKTIASITASGATSFLAAFKKINNDKLVTDIDKTTIIFLTDGEDSASADELVNEISEKKKSPRIVPIGIGMADNALLNQIANKANGGKLKPIYVPEESSQAYQNAFQEAMDLTQEKTETKIQIELKVAAKDKADNKNITSGIFKRELNHLAYDGKSSQTYSFTVDSKHPPSTCSLRFICDGIHLEANHHFTPEQCKRMIAGERINIDAQQIKYKDNRASSWLKF